MAPVPLASIAKRIATLEARKTALNRPFNLIDVLFPKQLPFVTDTKRFITAVCTRRAGKTYGIAAKLLDVARRKAGSTNIYITKSRINASRVFWGILKQMNVEYRLGGDAQEGPLCIKMPNGSTIYLSGCVDRAEIENFRGLPIGIVILDEAQSFPAFIEELVNSVLVPALMDYDGQLCLVGTPGPVPNGYFYDASISPAWSHHSWSVIDNPFIAAKNGGKTPQVLLAEELARRGITEDDPSIQREWFGRWVLDLNSLVFRYSPALNNRAAPICTNHVMGVDLGYNDADAICILGWNDNSSDLYLVEELITKKQNITPLLKQVQTLYDKYQPNSIEMDMGALGKKIGLEMRSRSEGLPIVAADKNRKLEHIELLNDTLRTGHFFAESNTRFAHDCALVEWDKSKPEAPKVSKRFHSDIADAVLYAYRACYQWIYKEPIKYPKVNTPEWFAAEAAKQKEQEEEMDEQMFAANRQALDAMEDSDDQWA